MRTVFVLNNKISFNFFSVNCENFIPGMLSTFSPIFSNAFLKLGVIFCLSLDIFKNKISIGNRLLLTRSFSSTLKDYQLTLTQSQLTFKFYAYESYAYDMMKKSRTFVVYLTGKPSGRDSFRYFRNPKSYKISLSLQKKK